MKIIYGTSNAAKVVAFKEILKNLKIDAEVETLKDIGFNREIVEDGNTFEENSEIKARAIKKYCNENNIHGKIIITDDAGLCIDYLNGDPGVHTARYAGDHPSQIESINKVLENMKNATKREERGCDFVCVLTAILDDGEKIVARGECRGEIAKEHGKLGGLTYSPIFIPQGFDKPMSEMDEKEYAESHNHREKAMRMLAEEFKKRNL